MLHRIKDSDVLDTLLDPELVTLEERSITLPLAGETELTIIRASGGIAYAMDSLEHAVRNIEEFMGIPLPTRHVIVWFDNELEERGINYATYISVATKELNESKESAIALLAHEAGHYYWGGLPRWKSEGAAHILAGVATNMLRGRLISTNCGQTQSIAEFERTFSYSTEVHDCHYSLGERLFRDLHRRLDDTSFRLAFRRLYLHDLSGDPVECGESDNRAICLVHEAFAVYASEKTAPAVERVLERWYHVPEPRDLSWIEETPIRPDITAIGGRIEEAYLSISPGGLPVSVVPVGPNRNPEVRLNLDYSFTEGNERKYLPIDIEVYREDGSELTRVETELSVLPLPADVTRHSHAINIYFWRDTGRFWVQIYWGDQKIAEATFEAVPEPDTVIIRGMVTDPDGQPLENVGFWFKQGEDRFWVETKPDGNFEVELPSGPFVAEFLVLQGKQWYFVGWYDGEGGMTTDPDQASKVLVEDADIEGLDIMLPANTEILLCPSGGYRSRQTGRCP